MSKPFLVALPVVVFLLYLIVATLARRPPSRHGANITSAVLLLLYFFGTAALGIFWVARQELPVFDLHYLFGYLTLFLVLLHLTFNLRIVSSFLRTRLRGRGDRSSPARARPAWIGRLAGLLAVGGTCFWLGLRAGSDRVVIEWPTSAAPVTSADQVPTVSSEEGVAQAAGDLPKPDGALWRIVLAYHEQASFSEIRALARSSNPYWGVPLERFKEYPGAALTPLPDPTEAPSVPIAPIFTAEAPPHAGVVSIGIDEVAYLLHHTTGVTAVRGGWELRASPSSGGLFPVELYVVAREVAGLEPGVYHYPAREERLERIDPGEVPPDTDLPEMLARLAGDDPGVRSAPATVVLSVMVSRTATKYGDRSYRYALLDAGHAAANLLLAARALGAVAYPVGSFDDQGVNDLLGIDGKHEFAALLVPIGSPASGGGMREAGLFRPLRAQEAPRETGAVGLVHAATSLRRERSANALPEIPAETQPSRPMPDNGQILHLPSPAPADDELFGTIRKRRSRRRYTDRPIPLAEFSGILSDAAGTATPSVEDARSRRCYVVVNNVESVAPGLYRYLPREHALAPRVEGSLRRDAYVASVRQEVAERAAAILVLTADVETMRERHGPRGYRFALFDCGIVGGRAYLSATARGLGVCSVGAFFDPEMQQLLGVPADVEIVLHTVDLGSLR